MEIISQILSILIQTTICSYLVLSLSKIFTLNKYDKLQIISTIILSLISTISCTLVKNLFPLANTLLSWILMFINLKFILKISISKSIIVILCSFIVLGLSELFVLFISSIILNQSPEIIMQNSSLCILLTILQLLTSIILIEIISIILKKFTHFKLHINRIKPQQLIFLTILLCICILPQLIFFMLNTYNYPWQILLFNIFQLVIIGSVILIYFNTSVEKDKAQSELVTSELHNKTMAGMVDGVRTLKHDYNNIMQALNGYVVTKQYDKLADHINKVLKECNIVNTLSCIDPKIFNDPAIYGIVGAKYFDASGKDINMEIDVITNISEIEFPMPELSRILGILLDNAIEATSKLPQEKQYIKLEMKFDKRKCADVIRVINTYDTTVKINLDDIYLKGVSSKKIKSGIGLWEVKKLISKVHNSQIYPSIEKDKFVQNIIIEKT